MLYKRDPQDIPASLKGFFLISEANMSDPNFFQTVVLMIEHNQDGAFGLVVNRRSSLPLGEAIPELASQRAANTTLYVGGPVQQEYLFVVHGDMPTSHESSEAAIQVGEGIYFEPAFSRLRPWFTDELAAMVPADDRPPIHLYLGYSGWSAGQLEGEIERGSWMIHPASTRIVFHHDPQNGWREALRQKGGIYKVFADSDPRPSLN
ncbi:MAG: YqgE/AlgH family protein [Leptospiraceae bacterium]|nr:YqgE/AlgH family protein [Leptospiraceae bacterium]